MNSEADKYRGVTVLCFVCSHPIMSTKWPFVSPASGEKRKANTIEIRLKIISQPWVKCSEHA